MIVAPNRRNEMNLRVIPTNVHGVLDYLASGVNLAFPGVLGLHDGAPWAALVPASNRAVFAAREAGRGIEDEEILKNFLALDPERTARG